MLISITCVSSLLEKKVGFCYPQSVQCQFSSPTMTYRAWSVPVLTTYDADAPNESTMMTSGKPQWCLNSIYNIHHMIPHELWYENGNITHPEHHWDLLNVSSVGGNPNNWYFAKYTNKTNMRCMYEWLYNAKKSVYKQVISWWTSVCMIDKGAPLDS